MTSPWHYLVDLARRTGELPPAGLQASDIARHLVAALHRGRLAGALKVYAPNYYLVRLNPGEWQCLAGAQEALEADLAAFIEQRAVAEQYGLVGPVTVHLEPEEDLPPGRVDVCAEVQEELPSGLAGEPQGTVASLRAVAGPASGHCWPLGLVPGVVFIGRSPRCGICLPDETVSLCHARLDHRRVTWILTDLASLNGSLVNGRPVKRHQVTPGDLLSLGSSQLLLEAAQ